MDKDTIRQLITTHTDSEGRLAKGASSLWSLFPQQKRPTPKQQTLRMMATLIVRLPVAEEPMPDCS